MAEYHTARVTVYVLFPWQNSTSHSVISQGILHRIYSLKWTKLNWIYVIPTSIEQTITNYFNMKDWDFRHLKCYLCKQVQIFMGNAIGQLLFMDSSILSMTLTVADLQGNISWCTYYSYMDIRYDLLNITCMLLSLHWFNTIDSAGVAYHGNWVCLYCLQISDPIKWRVSVYFTCITNHVISMQLISNNGTSIF